MGVLRTGYVVEGRYRVLRCIETGGMGAVYEVLDERIRHRRALKVMHPLLLDDPTLRARFALEARITGDVESDHLVNVLDAGVEEGENLPFIVMERLRGESLGSLLRGHGPLDPDDVVVFLWQAALGLEKTHAAGIVHRDLKPENLFLTHRDDGSPCVKILDFGIAKVVANTLPDVDTRPMLGTPFYMSPEQARNDRWIDARADVYALGQIAYSLLVGEPYWHETFLEHGSPFLLVNAVLKGAPEPPTKRAARRKGIVLPEAFDAWFARVTAPAADDRFAKAIPAVAALADAMGVVLPIPSNHGHDAARSSRVPRSPGKHFLALVDTETTDEALARTLDATTRDAPRPSFLAPKPDSRATHPEPHRVSLLMRAAMVFAVAACGLFAARAELPWGLANGGGVATTGPAPPATPRGAGSTRPAGLASADVSACMVSQLAPDSIASGKPIEPSAVCGETDPRKGAMALRTYVVLARSGGGPTEAMREWAQLSWYEMAAFAVIRTRCCAAPPPLELPPPLGACEPLDKALDALGAAAADDGEVEAAVARTRKSLICLVSSGGERSYAYRGRPPDGAEDTLRRTLERASPRSR